MNIFYWFSLVFGIVGIHNLCFVLLLSGQQTAQEIDFNKLVKCISKVESNDNPKAVNKKSGARGQYQFMPKTWVWLLTDIMKEVKYADFKYAFNAEVSKRACKMYLQWIYKHLKTQLPNRKDYLELISASYNSGHNRVIKSKGIPKIKETENYVKKVKKLYYQEGDDAGNKN